ncbi:MAG: threonine/serine exporter family protein [Clostridia bacterium]|nr:threonine/serine exporter family protein [Clostridia bacterium]
MNSAELMEMLFSTFAIAASTLIYAVLMRVKLRHLPSIGLGAGMTYLIFALLNSVGLSLLLSNMIAAMIATIYGEIMARLFKAPVTIYSLPSIIPLVPGGSLYYAMAALMNGNEAEFVSRGTDTVMIALGLAIGIISVSVIGVFLPRPGFKRK